MVSHRNLSWVPGAAVLLTVASLSFSIISYRSAAPLAPELLRGHALLIGQLVEQVSLNGLSPSALKALKTPDVAYFALIDQGGRLVFHTNPELWGEKVEDQRFQPLFSESGITEQTVRLGTGETVYEFQQLTHPAGSRLVVRIALHTWQADRLTVKAQGGLVTVFALTLTVWVLGVAVWRYYQREFERREQKARTERLAALGTLAATLAHEVRTPLAGIKGFAQLLVEQLDQDRHKRYLSTIINESERLEHLVGDLLDFVKQEHQPGGEADMVQELHAAWDALQIGGEGVDVCLDCSELPETVMLAVQPERLRQVLLNLLGNAVHAIKGAGSITVTAEQQQEVWVVTISDSGTGFASDDLIRAFDPFYTTNAGGSGLGLPLCRKIIEGYGGSIAIANRSPHGAVVTVSLPGCKE